MPLGVTADSGGGIVTSQATRHRRRAARVTEASTRRRRLSARPALRPCVRGAEPGRGAPDTPAPPRLLLLIRAVDTCCHCSSSG